MATNWQYWGAFVVVAALSLLTTAPFFVRRIGPFVARKVLHISVIGICAAVLWLEGSSDRLLITTLVCALILTAMVYRGWFSEDSGHRKAWGIAWFAWLFAVIVLFSEGRNVQGGVTALAVLAFADGFAALFGRGSTWGWFTPTTARKSLRGSVVFVAISAAILALAGAGWLHLSGWVLVVFAVVGALWIAALEAVPGGGADNVTVGLGAWWWMAVPPMLTAHAWLWLAWGTAAVVIVLAMAWRMRWLAVGGVMAAFCVGIPLLPGGWMWLLPLALFFVSGSLLDKLPLGPASAKTDNQGQPRSAIQVLCNGALPALLALWWVVAPTTGLFLAYLSVVAAATGDTWSSTLGERLGGTPRDLRTGKKVAPGFSGGVTLWGSMAGLFGSAAIACFALTTGLGHALLVLLSGLVGNLADSWIGSAYQNQPQGSTDQLKWMTNNSVNFISLCVALLFFVGASTLWLLMAFAI